MKKILIALAAVALSPAYYAAAQTKKESDTTKKTVIIFNSGSDSRAKQSDGGFKNILKVSPVAFISGKIPFSYERKLSDLFSVQASIGLTTKNYLKSLILESSTSNGDDANVTYKNSTLPADFKDSVDPINNFERRKASLGFMFSVQPRIYISEEAMEGTFFGLSFNMARFNYSIPGLVTANGESTYAGAAKKEFENVKTVMVNFGNQKLYDRLSLEYAVGVGIKSVNGEKYRAGTYTNKFYEEISAYNKKSDLAFDITLKLGFQL